MSIIFSILFWVLEWFKLILIARVILDLVQMFSRDWEPKGFKLVAANLVYRLTDPPLRFLGRFIPPVRFGGIGFDMGFIALFFGVSIAQHLIQLAI